MNACDGPFGIPYIPGEIPRTTFETPQELIARRPELEGFFRPVHHEWGNPEMFNAH